MANKSVKVVEEADDRPNTFGWLQMDKKSTKRLRELTMAAPTATSVLLYCMERMSRTNSLLVSQKVMGDALGVSDRTIRTSLAVLEDKNFIERTQVGASTVITVNTRVAWQGKRGARYAHFCTDIVAGEKEQRKPIDGRPDLANVPILNNDERLLITNNEIDPPDQGEIELD